MTAIWLPAAAQVETWAGTPPVPRVFDPNVFDPTPVFDTGTAAGTWTEKIAQAEVWVSE